MILYEREIDGTRRNLAYRTDFCLLDAFRLFDLNGRSYISKYEIENGLNKMGVYPNYNDLTRFVKKFD